MCNLKYDTNEPIYETETDSQTQKTNLRLPVGKGGGGGINQEFGISRYKLLYIKQINNKALLYNMGNCIQQPIIGEGNGTPLQYSCLGNPVNGGAWQATVHGITKSRTQLSDFTFTFHFHALEKEMATHSSVLAWRIPGTGEPGGLPSMGLHRVGHD